MHNNDSRGIPITTPWVQERYGPSFLFSVGFHAVLVLLFLFGGYLLPTNVIRIGSGSGGGTGGDVPTTVGVIDELSGGAGMVKPSIVPKPPALQEKAPPKNEDKAIPLPKTIEKKKKPDTKETVKSAKTLPETNMIPTAPEPGSGGTGGQSGGSGGGFGGGNGVSIGPGSGGFGDSTYARAVERRIGEGWSKPIGAGHVEIVYSFYINARGVVSDVKLEKSSGNTDLDRNAERAILLLNSTSNPLPAPPPEFRGRPIQFVAQFIYPPNQ
jgi:TonB family protein